jgi:hypothetical protein
MTKIKERGRRKAALSDRKSAAAQARMKNIASLAADERVSKKKRKAGAGKFHNLSHQFFVLTLVIQKTCSERMTRTGRFIANLYVILPK